MKRSPLVWTVLACACALLLASATRAHGGGHWCVPSPDHEQTFAYGMEQNRVWAQRGRDRHLAVLLQFTNDPFVDRDHPREVDNFTFSFPRVTLGKEGRTFFFRAPDGRQIPVATKRPDFFGIDEIRLLPTASLIVDRPH